MLVSVSGYRSFQYKLIRLRTKYLHVLGLKNEGINYNVFLVHSQTILEVNKMFVQFHCLSLYRNDWFPRLAQKAPGDLAKCLFRTSYAFEMRQVYKYAVK